MNPTLRSLFLSKREEIRSRDRTKKNNVTFEAKRGRFGLDFLFSNFY